MRHVICVDDKKGSIPLPLINGREYLEKVHLLSMETNIPKYMIRKGNFI